MAGFDFDFRYTEVYDVYVKACLRAGKRRAHQLRCRWRVQRLPGEFALRCVVDGQTRRLDLLGRALEHDIPSVCEGVGGFLAPSRAREVGMGFVDLYLVGRDIDLGDAVQVLRPRRDARLYYPVYDFAAADRGTPKLRARLCITEDVVTDFGLGRYPPVVVLEELHTALEQTLRELLQGVKPRAHWPELVTAAENAGLLDCRVDDHGHEGAELLVELTHRRNAAKHRDGDPEDPWLGEHWECVSSLLERLVSKL